MWQLIFAIVFFTPWADSPSVINFDIQFDSEQLCLDAGKILEADYSKKFSGGDYTRTNTIQWNCLNTAK